MFRSMILLAVLSESPSDDSTSVFFCSLEDFILSDKDFTAFALIPFSVFTSSSAVGDEVSIIRSVVVTESMSTTPVDSVVSSATFTDDSFSRGESAARRMFRSMILLAVLSESPSDDSTSVFFRSRGDFLTGERELVKFS